MVSSAYKRREKQRDYKRKRRSLDNATLNIRSDGQPLEKRFLQEIYSKSVFF